MVVDVPDTGQQLLLGDGQPLLLATDSRERAQGGQGDVLQAVIEEQCVIQIIGGGEMELSYDACSQRVIPWQKVTVRESSQLRKDIAVLRMIDDELIDLQRQVDVLRGEAERSAENSEGCDEIARRLEVGASALQKAAEDAQFVLEEAMVNAKAEMEEEDDMEDFESTAAIEQAAVCKKAAAEAEAKAAEADEVLGRAKADAAAARKVAEKAAKDAVNGKIDAEADACQAVLDHLQKAISAPFKEVREILDKEMQAQRRALLVPLKEHEEVMERERAASRIQARARGRNVRRRGTSRAPGQDREALLAQAEARQVRELKLKQLREAARVPPSLSVEQLREMLKLEHLTSGLLSLCESRGMIGLRCYASEQALTVRYSGTWVDAEVIFASQGGFHQLLYNNDEFDIDLHPWNHAPLLLPHASFEEMRSVWMGELRAQHCYLDDDVSDRRLDIRTQCFAVPACTADGDQMDAEKLSIELRSFHTSRTEGASADDPVCVLLTGESGAGKTCLMSQVVMHALEWKSSDLIPIFIKVRSLQRRLVGDSDTFAAAFNWVDAYLRLEYAEKTPGLYLMLRQALMARRAMVLLDGLCEAGAGREKIERHIAEVLAPQGHIILVSLRPASISDALASFPRLQLLPLTEGQQRELVAQRIGREHANELMPHVHAILPRSAETGQCVSSNPLMLSIVVSIFELRGGVNMPKTITETYQLVTQSMLERAEADTGSHTLSEALEAIFCEMKEQRVIKTEHLEAAALRIDSATSATEDATPETTDQRNAVVRAKRLTAPAAVNGKGIYKSVVKAAAAAVSHAKSHAKNELLKELVIREKVQLLSLLQAEPFEMQAAHISLQEFFVARALLRGEDTFILPMLPWQLSGQWANIVEFGCDAGDVFAQALLRMACLAQEGAPLTRMTGLHPGSSAAARAVGQIMIHAQDLVSIDFTCSDVDDAMMCSMWEPLRPGSLSSLTEIRLAQNPIGNRGILALAMALARGALVNIQTLVLDKYAVEKSRRTKELHLARRGLNDDDVLLLVTMLANDSLPSLQELDLLGNNIGDAGAQMIARACNDGIMRRLTHLCLARNEIGEAGMVALADAVDGVTTLPVIETLRAARNAASSAPVHLALHRRLNPRPIEEPEPALKSSVVALVPGVGVQFIGLLDLPCTPHHFYFRRPSTVASLRDTQCASKTVRDGLALSARSSGGLALSARSLPTRLFRPSSPMQSPPSPALSPRLPLRKLAPRRLAPVPIAPHTWRSAEPELLAGMSTSTHADPV